MMQIMRADDATMNSIVPAHGQPAYGLTSHTLKIGDGVTTWENLPKVGEALSVIDIPAQANLNDYENPGWYKCELNGIVTTLSNTPTSNAFFLEVGRHAGVYQRLVEFMTDYPKVYFRNYYYEANPQWGSWYRQYTTVDKPPVSWDEVSSKPSTFPPSSHEHFYLKTEGDNRNVATTPDDYNNAFTFRGLKTQAAISGPVTDLSYLLGLRGWADSSGGPTHELLFNSAGVYHRKGAITWGSWAKFYTSRDTIPLANGGTGATSAQGIRTNLGMSGSPMYSLWNGSSNLTSQLTISGIAANPGYNTFILIFKEGYAGYKIPIVLPFSYVPDSKGTIFDVGDASTGAHSRFYAWKSSGNLYLLQYGYIGSGASLVAVYGRY